MICRMLSQEPDCNVVDLGAASVGNCRMFSRNGARVYIDTSGNSLRLKIAESNEIETIDIDDLMARCPTPIDVLLFWDLLDYLSLDAIKKISGRFSEVMRSGGMIYALASRQRYIPNTPTVIDMVREDRIRFLNNDATEREAPQYPPKKLEQSMPGFVLEKLYLLQNGVQEHLFLFEGVDESF